MLDLLARLDPWALLVILAPLEMWGLLVLLALLVPEETPDQRVRLAPWALRVRQVR